MSPLAITASIIGLLALIIAGYAYLYPTQVLKKLSNYPRSIWPGRIFVTIDLIWAAYAVTTLHLGGVDAYKIHLIWVTPLCIYMAMRYMDDLLSVRALGGFLLLVAGPILGIMRWHPSLWRLVVAVLCYAWIIVGLFLLMEPWWFRRIAQLIKTENGLKIAAIAKGAVGLALIVLGIFVY